MSRALLCLLLVVACAGCMDTRSASLGVDEPREEAVRDDDGDGAEPEDEPPAPLADARAPEPSESEDAGAPSVDPAEGGPRAAVDGGSDASVSQGDASRAADRRDAQVRDGGRDGGQYTNPICRVEPWHCN